MFAMNFGTVAKKQLCDICRKDIEIGEDKSASEGFNSKSYLIWNTPLIALILVHKKCFKCAICDTQLSAGDCARDHGLANLQFMKNYHKSAPVWFCTEHKMIATGDKHSMLKKKHGAK